MEWETDGWREIKQTAILTDNFFFSWPWHAVLSSRPHLTLLLLLSQRCSIGGNWGQLPSAGRSHWLQASSDSVLTDSHCHGQLHILFHNAHLCDLLPLIYTSASLIDGSVKGQYVTLPHWATVDLKAMATKGYCGFPKAPALLERHYQVV